MSRTRTGLGLAAVFAVALQQAACAQAPSRDGDVPTADPTPAPAAAEPQPVADTLPPGERYAQTRLLLGVTEGIEPVLLEALDELFGPPGGDVPTVPDLATYQGAGYRIASADSILDAVTDLAAYRAVAEGELRADLAAIEADHPEAVAALDPEILAEEILLVRSAVLDSLETLAPDADWPDGALAAYRTGTLRARNELEYVVFARDMDALEGRSIEESAGRLDAFHRMMDDNEDAAFLRERILAAEEMNRQLTDEHRRYATQRTIRTLIFMLPAISSYFRYR